MMLIYGGDALPAEQAPSANFTFETHAVGDMWSWQTGNCPLNCSQNGVCDFGFCYCAPGYYGTDCSNFTCPGSGCSYNEFSHEQECRHCCAAPYVHTDADVYVPGVRKSACDADYAGASHGICDGFGRCQCQPPFLGDDCSIKNCPDDCTSPSNGICILEYPVARCDCIPPYTGNNCSTMQCLNNCSYPNGLCDPTTGMCTCNKLYSPYNKSFPWSQYDGPDCSYVPAFAGARGSTVDWFVVALVLAALAAGAQAAL